VRYGRYADNCTRVGPEIDKTTFLARYCASVIGFPPVFRYASGRYKFRGECIAKRFCAGVRYVTADCAGVVVEVAGTALERAVAESIVQFLSRQRCCRAGLQWLPKNSSRQETE